MQENLFLGISKTNPTVLIDMSKRHKMQRVSMPSKVGKPKSRGSTIGSNLKPVRRKVKASITDMAQSARE